MIPLPASMVPEPDLDVRIMSTEDLYSNLIFKATNGVRVRTTSAPALSTQFVRSSKTTVARAGVQGSFAEIIYPKNDAIKQRIVDNHDPEDCHMYRHTRASAAFHAGYGERSARAFAREESSYQLKGVFQAATLAYSKLRARVDARGGDTSSIDTIFAQFWGLSREAVDSIPRLYIAGSEAQRLSAMEDRAYHSLSAHPSIAGGFRVDTASLTPDALGIDIPLNWPRLRTAIKAIAMSQLSGDQLVSETIGRLNASSDFKFRLDLTIGSQPVYVRPRVWERIVEMLVVKSHESSGMLIKPAEDDGFGYTLRASMADMEGYEIVHHPSNQVAEGVSKIASFVSSESEKSLARTISVIEEYRQARAQMDLLGEDGFVEMEESELSKTFDVPKFKAVRRSLYSGQIKEKLGIESLPDVTHHGRPRQILDMQELREAGLSANMDVPGILNMAVYMTARDNSVRKHAYRFMMHMSKITKKDDSNRPVAERLRNEKLYKAEETRAYGALLFGTTFVAVLDMLFKNVLSHEYRTGLSIKRELWNYLSARTSVKRPCPVPGDWRDLVPYLHNAPEGWTLFYWVRISIGKLHHQACSDILAPVTAGAEMDVLVMVRKGIQKRALYWTEYYTAAYQEIEATIKSLKTQLAETESKRKVQQEGKAIEGGKYVPPSVRRQADLENVYLHNQEVQRITGFTTSQYKRMVECQSKAKFFSQLDVFTIDRQLTVGITDEKMLQMFIEFYQARWISLEKRINRAIDNGKVFRLGEHEFYEHPWGELVEEYPNNPTDMIEWMETLDYRAWTVPPSWLYQQFTKSISELWDDIRREILKVSDYAHEVHSGLISEQEDAEALSTAQKLTNATYKVDAVEIPVQGFRPAHTMPARQINIVDYNAKGDGTAYQVKSIPVDVGDFAVPSTSKSDPLPTHTLDDDEDEDDDDDDGMDFLPDDAVDFSEVEMHQCISMSQIWHVLGLPDCEDNLKKFYLGMPIDYDLDGQHLESTYGPTIYVGEESQIQRKWRHMVPGIMARINRSKKKELSDDM